jgi:hypothetical protein
VLDEGGLPVSEPVGVPSLEATGGRGLHLVRSVSQAWGSGYDAYGRTLVWAEVPVRPMAVMPPRRGAGRAQALTG